MRMKHLHFFLLTAFVLGNISSAFAGKEEIRIFLSKQAVIKYGKGEKKGYGLVLAAGMTP